MILMGVIYSFFVEVVFLQILISTKKMGKILLSILLIFGGVKNFAQDNYEIQIYGSETVAKGATMVELHSNYTFGGTRQVLNKVLPTHDILHETVEITHGFNEWFEIGFYLFNGYRTHNKRKEVVKNNPI